MLATIRADGARFIRQIDPAGRKPHWALWLLIVLLNPGFQFVLLIRLQAALGRLPAIGGALRRVVWYLATRSFGCDVDPHVTFGPGLYIPHPTGIVIGGSARFGSDCTVLQNVTVGRSGANPVDPVFGDDVLLASGAVVLGPVRVGDGARVGANSVVLKDVPAGRVAVGVAARLLEPDQ